LSNPINLVNSKVNSYMTEYFTLLAFSGRKGSGKDTAAHHLATHLEHCQVESFAAPLKEICKQVFGLSHAQVYENEKKEVVDPRLGYTPRLILQVVGTDLFRDALAQKLPDISKNIGSVWVSMMKQKIIQAKLEAEQSKTRVTFMITDCRFQDEVEMVQDMGGFVIFIDRPNNYVYGTDSHASEDFSKVIPLANKVIVNDKNLADFFEKLDHLNK